ncbi:Cerato-platanin-domain-containing protein [Aspergillus aurantiobrunneus]
MQLTTALLALLPATLTLASPAPRSGFERVAKRQSASTLSYDPLYSVAGSSTNTVACSGVLAQTYPTFGSLPGFPLIGGAPTIADGSSPSCGACYQVSWTDQTGATSSINVIGIDVATQGFNVATEAMDQLTGGRAIEFGRVDVTWTEVAREVCYGA